MQLGQKVMVTVAAQQLCPEGKHKQSGNLGLGVVLSGALGGPALAGQRDLGQVSAPL